MSVCVCVTYNEILGFPGAQMVKNLPAMQETWVQPWVRKIPWRREWQLTPVFLYSCLEKSVDRGAWWATVHGVTRSRT